MTAALRCPVCRSASTRHLFEVITTAPFSAHECGACGLVFTWPRPTAEELESFYSAAYFSGNATGGLGYDDYRSLGELNARRSWRTLQRFTALDDVRPRRLLDVGCATGGFLAEAASEGWDCVGLEMSSAAAASARADFGLEVHEGDLHGVDLPSGAFGLVTMWHVLEHMTAPAAGLARARDLLAPGGLLFIELPNWNSVGRTLKRAEWSQMKPPEHVNFFTSASLGAAVRQAGFRPVRTGTDYPSMTDKARIRRWSQPLHALGAVAAGAASTLGRGGYLRLLARRS